MILPSIRYPLDKTGKNPNNLVVGELHRLSAREIRSVAPTYGAFYGDSMVVYDAMTGVLLERGTQYELAEFLQDASMQYEGGDIWTLVLIKDKNVSHQVRINYQVVGGNFTTDSSKIKELYDAVMMDNRPVDWTNVLDKPILYPPNLHHQLLNTIYGFEPLVAAIERLGNRITLTDVPAFEYLIDWINQRLDEFESSDYGYHVRDRDNPHEVNKTQVGLGEVENLPVITQDDIDSELVVRKYVTYDMLLLALQGLGTNSTYRLTTSSTEISEGRQLLVRVDTTGVEEGTRLYWTIEHESSSSLDFVVEAGIITISNSIAFFSVMVRLDEESDDNEVFRIALRKKSVEGPIVSRSEALTIKNTDPADPELNRWFRTQTLCCVNHVDMAFNVYSRYAILGNMRGVPHRSINKGNGATVDMFTAMTIPGICAVRAEQMEAGFMWIAGNNPFNAPGVNPA